MVTCQQKCEKLWTLPAAGRIACPWGGCGVFPRGEAELAGPATGPVMRFTDLSIHRIAEHGFYQGRGGRYRLEPNQVAEVLRIEPP